MLGPQKVFLVYIVSERLNARSKQHMQHSLPLTDFIKYNASNEEMNNKQPEPKPGEHQHQVLPQ